MFPQSTGEILVDMDDLIFYEVAMEKREDDANLNNSLLASDYYEYL